MIRRRFSLLHGVVLLAMLAGLVPAAFACRIILPPFWPPEPPRPWPVPPPPPPPVVMPMEVREHKASIEIRDQLARVTVKATFFNPNGNRLEGTYFFPIGPRAGVNSFSMTVNGKTIEAELLPADKAKKVYEDIVRQQKDPAILEYFGEGMLRARVFPIEPHKEVAIELSYDEQVGRDGTLSRLRYPLLSARPEGNQAIKALTIDATIHSKTPLKSIFVPGFNATVTKTDDLNAHITFTANGLAPDRDFELVYSAQKGTVGADWLAYKKGDQGYFMLVAAPQSELQAQELAAKDITFVIDISGSMSGDKIGQARDALTFCINSLGKNDHFDVISFSDEVTPLWRDSMPADAANRQKALEFVASLRARGGTAIDDALAAALKAGRAPGKVPLIVFITDGCPTIGETIPEAILKRVPDATCPRIFTFGLGNDVNTRLLNGLAAKARGFATYVAPNENLEVALSNFYEKVASPVMTDLQLDSAGLTLSQLNPAKLPDLFRNGQITITGRFTGSGTKTFKLSGDVNGKREVFNVAANLDGDALNSYIPRLWATQRVGFLQEQILLNGRKDELVNEIQLLGKEYGIVTPYTSFLIVEQNLQANTLERLRGQAAAAGVDTTHAVYDQAGNHPDNQWMNSLFIDGHVSGGRAEKDDAAAVGESAVRQAKSMGSLAKAGVGSLGGAGHGGAAAAAAPAPTLAAPAKEALREAGVNESTLAQAMVQVRDKTFYRRAADGFYYDSVFAANATPKPDFEVKAWSDAFLKLLTDYPELRHYLIAGNQLVIQLNGKVFRITE